MCEWDWETNLCSDRPGCNLNVLFICSSVKAQIDLIVGKYFMICVDTAEATGLFFVVWESSELNFLQSEFASPKKRILKAYYNYQPLA